MDDLDLLVDEIASRVQARLGSLGGGNGAASGGGLAARPLTLAEKLETPCCSSAGECEGSGLCARRRPEDTRRIIELGACRVGGGPGVGAVAPDMAHSIDHTLLKAEASADDIRKLCDEARKHGFASVCVNAANVSRAASLLRGSGVMVCAVVGFPLGAATPQAKAFEAREAVRHGAQEIDMVMNIGAMKSRDYALVLEDINRVVAASCPARVKVILETGTLSTEEKIIGCALSKAAGAAFVKTSTGFGAGGATAEDVALMRKVVGSDIGVKASGGVRTREDAEKMIAAGATRIGASASVAILTGQAPASGAAAGGKPKGQY
jgi:deoxyribose-phosphate aldolase